MSINFSFLDELPNEWKKARVKNILDYNHHYPIGDGDHGSIKPEMYQDDGIPYLRVQNLTWGFNINYDNLVYISDEVNQANSKSILMPNDILIAKTGATVGKMAIIPESMKQANTTSSVGKITINQKIFNNLYFAYLFSSPMFQEQIKEKAYQKSAQPGFNIDDLIEFNIIIPPRDIQNKIANHLDKETTKIDLTIAKNEELIKLLSEKRVALINQVVTKGLNPDVVMKDSGVEWIGEIPEHWNVNKIKNYFFIHNGSTPKDKEENWGGDICWITPADYKTADIYINNSSRTITKIGLNSCGTTLVPKDSIIVSNRAPIGTVAIANVDLCTNQGCKSLAKKRKINEKFVYYLLSINEKELNKLGRGTTFMELSSYDLGTFRIPIAPNSEQNEIVDYLNKETLKISKTIKKIQKNISLLDEYKTSLIHHVVTGKIDVRGEEI